MISAAWEEKSEAGSKALMPVTWAFPSVKAGQGVNGRILRPFNACTRIIASSYRPRWVGAHVHVAEQGCGISSAQYLDKLAGSLATTVATIGDNCCWFACPLLVQEVQGTLQDSWYAPVVLCCDKLKGVQGLDLCLPDFCVLVLGFVYGWHSRLV